MLHRAIVLAVTIFCTSVWMWPALTHQDSEPSVPPDVRQRAEEGVRKHLAKGAELYALALSGSQQMPPLNPGDYIDIVASYEPLKTSIVLRQVRVLSLASESDNNMGVKAWYIWIEIHPKQVPILDTLQRDYKLLSVHLAQPVKKK